MAVFTRADEERVEAGIQQVEQKTAAEIVVVTMARSSTYPEVRIATASVLAVLAGGLALLWEPWLSAGWMLLIELVVAPLGFFIAGVPAVLRQLVPAVHAQR